jgi:hypothetical protein
VGLTPILENYSTSVSGVNKETPPAGIPLFAAFDTLPQLQTAICIALELEGKLKRGISFSKVMQIAFWTKFSAHTREKLQFYNKDSHS